MSGQQISTADIARFIDADVTGADRELAKRFMASQPENSRGDFVYLSPDGRIISNKDVLREAAMTNGLLPSLGARRTMSYPPVADGNQGGPFYREYSLQGITAGFGFVTIPCNDELFLQGDAGDAYFGENGKINGQTEGGLQVTDSPPMTMEPPSIQLYGRSTYYPAPGYTGVTNPTHYNCGSSILVSYGQLPPPNLGYFFASAGIPQYNPTVYQIPGGSISATNVSYVYANVPSDFYMAGYDGTSTYTPCLQCYMRRMDSIAQAAYNPYTGECFGMCDGHIGIRWDQIYMGQLTQYSNTQSNGVSSISVTFKISGENWFGSVQKFPDTSRVQSSTANLPANTINWDYEGIDLAPNSPTSLNADGVFNQLQPQPTPTPSPTTKPCLPHACY